MSVNHDISAQKDISNTHIMQNTGNFNKKSNILLLF